MIKVEDLSFSYGEKKILKNVNFHLNNSEIISLIGPNGSGKSTLLRLIAGILKPTNSSITINNKLIDKYKPNEIAKEIAFLPQFQEKMNNITVYQLVSMGRAPYQLSGWINSREDNKKIKWAMDYMDINDLKGRMVNTLSGGEKQRVWIGMILAQDTCIIMLDEPVTYMDMKHQWNLLNTINDLKENHNKSIITVFHDINHAIEVSDRIYMMKEGEVVASGYCDAIITENAIKEVYDIDVYVQNFQKLSRQVVVPTSIHNKGGICND